MVTPVRPDTIARSLAIGNPADGPYVLDTVRRTGGAVAHVSDAEVVEGIRLLARTEGVFAETAGGVTVATTRKLVQSGQLDPDAETVLLITGDGLKTLDAVAGQIGPDGDGAVQQPGRARGVGGARALSPRPRATGRGRSPAIDPRAERRTSSARTGRRIAPADQGQLAAG